jgi:putative membrane protein
MFHEDRFTTRMPSRTIDEWSPASIFAMVIHLVLVAVFIWAVIWVVRYAVKYLNARSIVESPLDIAKSRYAKGELTKAEFDEIKKELK